MTLSASRGNCGGQLGRHALREFVGLSFVCRFAGETPAFVIDPSHQSRELRSQMNSLFWREAVAQNVQHCAKRVIGVGSIAEMVIVRELFEPSIRLLDRVIQGRNLSVIHGFVLGSVFSALLEYSCSNFKAETTRPDIDGA